MPRGQAASLYPSSSGLEATGTAVPYRWWVEQLSQDNHPPADLMAFRHQEKPLRNDATVLAAYMLTTMTCGSVAQWLGRWTCD